MIGQSSRTSTSTSLTAERDRQSAKYRRCGRRAGSQLKQSRGSGYTGPTPGRVTGQTRELFTANIEELAASVRVATRGPPAVFPPAENVTVMHAPMVDPHARATLRHD